MKKLLITSFAALSLIAARADARDSICVIANNGKIAVTTLEHRDGADRRATEVTLIFGMHFLKGRLDNKDSGQITLKEPGSERYAYWFSGNISVDYTRSEITLKGKFTNPSDMKDYSVDAKMAYIELDP